MVFIISDEIQEDTCLPRQQEFALYAYIHTALDLENFQIRNGQSTATIMVEGVIFTLDVETADEFIDRVVCETELLSGSNTMTNGIDEMVYTFDGETDCDESPTQMLSINGAEATEVAGVSCLTVEPCGLLGLFSGLIGVVFLRCRRS